MDLGNEQDLGDVRMAKKTKWIIEDWAGNVCFFGKTFKTFDDAEEFLSEQLGDDYEEERQEYEIQEQ